MTRLLQVGVNRVDNWLPWACPVDDHSRLACSEVLTDERQHTAMGFWQRAQAFFAAQGITV